MCFFGGSKSTPPPPPVQPPAPVQVTDTDVVRARNNETDRLRALSGSSSTMLTAGKDMGGTATAGKTKLGE